jgi:hypothetical protein
MAKARISFFAAMIDTVAFTARPVILIPLRVHILLLILLIVHY